MGKQRGSQIRGKKTTTKRKKKVTARPPMVRNEYRLGLWTEACRRGNLDLTRAHVSMRDALINLTYVSFNLEWYRMMIARKDGTAHGVSQRLAEPLQAAFKSIDEGYRPLESSLEWFAASKEVTFASLPASDKPSMARNLAAATYHQLVINLNVQLQLEVGYYSMWGHDVRPTTSEEWAAVINSIASDREKVPIVLTTLLHHGHTLIASLEREFLAATLAYRCSLEGQHARLGAAELKKLTAAFPDGMRELEPWSASSCRKRDRYFYELNKRYALGYKRIHKVWNGGLESPITKEKLTAADRKLIAPSCCEAPLSEECVKKALRRIKTLLETNESSALDRDQVEAGDE